MVATPTTTIIIPFKYCEETWTVKYLPLRNLEQRKVQKQENYISWCAEELAVAKFTHSQLV